MSTRGLLSSFLSRVRRDGEEYEQVPVEDEETGRIRLENPPVYDSFVQEADQERLLSEGKEEQEEVVARPSLGGMEVCTVCGVRISCFVFWIVFCIVMGLLLVASALSYAKWTVLHSSKDVVTLNAPSFGQELGCIDDSRIFTSQKRLYTVPIGKDKHDHYLNVRGGAVGTVTLVPGFDDPAEDDHTVSVELTLRSDQKDLLDLVVIEQQDPETTANSFWRLSTPYPRDSIVDKKHGEPSNKNCMRFDVTLRIPPSLKKLHVAAHSTAHVRFGDDTNSTVPSLAVVNATTGAVNIPEPLRTLEDAFFTFYSPWENNLLLTSTALAADRMNVEMTGGFMVGSLALRERTRILTQRGGAQVHVDVVTTPSLNSSAAELRTVTGFGRTELAVHNPAQRHLSADHLSTGNGDLVLHYENTGFSGPVEVNARALHAHNLQGTGKGVPTVAHSDMDWTTVKEEDGVGGVEEKKDLWVLDKNGGDRVKVSSRQGWVGLFF